MSSPIKAVKTLPSACRCNEKSNQDTIWQAVKTLPSARRCNDDEQPAPISGEPINRKQHSVSFSLSSSSSSTSSPSPSSSSSSSEAAEATTLSSFEFEDGVEQSVPGFHLLPEKRQIALKRLYQQCVYNAGICVCDKNKYPTKLSSIIDSLKTEKEKKYAWDNFKLSSIDERCVVSWQNFATAVLEDKISTQGEKKWTNVILRAHNKGCYDLATYGKWHHLVPLCMFGSVHDPRNYARLRPGLHLLVHAALAYFFPSLYSLQYALCYMLNRKDDTMKKLSGQQLVDYLQIVENDEEVYATARIEAAQRTADNIKGNQYGKKPPSADPVLNRNRGIKLRSAQRGRDRASLEAAHKVVPPELHRRQLITTEVSESTEHDHLRAQRKKLLKADGLLFLGLYSQEEVDSYINSYPGAIFFHFPQTKEKQAGLYKRLKKSCKHPGCEHQSYRAGLCETHMRTHGQPRKRGPRKQCEFENCNKYARQGGQCHQHGDNSKAKPEV